MTPPRNPFRLEFECPGCNALAKIRVRPPRSVYDYECDECDFQADAQVVTLRAKRQRTIRNNGTVLYQRVSFRVIDMAGREHHYEKPLRGFPDLEIRAGDVAILFFDDVDDESLTAVANTTIRSTARVQIWMPPKKGCAVLIAFFTLLATAAIAVAMQ